MPSADIELKRNDTRPYIDAVLSDANGPRDLSGCTVKFYMVDSAGNVVINQTSTGSYVTIEDSTAGAVRYKLQAADTSTGGKFRAEWQATWPDGTQGTFPNNGHSTVFIRDDLDST